MAVFNAGSILEPLDYDFTAMAGPPNNIRELAEAKGTIKEPTSLQVQAYMQASAREMQRIRREARAVVEAAEKEQDGEAPDPGADDATDSQLAAVADRDVKRSEAARKREAAMVSKLCSGDPSTETLLLLPHRIANEFGKWLVQEVLDPEAVTGAGTPHLQMVRSPAAG